MHIEQAIDLYEQAADKGHSISMYVIGKFYERRKGVLKDCNKAIIYYQMAADKGLSIAMYAIGKLYETGKCVLRDYNKAIIYYQMAADKEHPKALYHLANCYEYGIGIQQDHSEACILYWKSAQKKYYPAKKRLSYIAKINVLRLVHLADLFFYGNEHPNISYENNLPQDYYQAVILYTQAADLGNAAAMFSLAMCYEKGLGVQEDHEKALTLIHNSSQKGYSNAIYYLREQN